MWIDENDQLEAVSRPITWPSCVYKGLVVASIFSSTPIAMDRESMSMSANQGTAATNISISDLYEKLIA
jgi:hypothetical protein